MTEKDLCVGDLFKVNGYVTRIKDIVHLDKEGYYVAGCTTLENRYIPVCYEPIPLTREILEANGFEEFDGWMLYEYEGSEIAWTGTILKGGGEIGNFEFPAIMYVHQLQHVLRLAGIDKEIKLED
jgi:hypothetical protein